MPLQKLSPLIGIVPVGLAIAVVHHEVSIYHLQDIKNDLFGLPSYVIASMIGLTLISYLLLSLYDFLALEYAGEKLIYAKVLLTSFLSYVISNNVGHALISGGSMRYRLYSRWGISTGSIVKVIVFCAMTYLLGAATILMGVGIAEPARLNSGQALPFGSVYIILCLAAGLLLTWWGFIFLHDKPIALRGHTVSVPSPWLAARQTLLGLADIFVASLVLFLPLLHMVEMPYSTFIIIYMLAQLAGLLSQIPGGLGVFEASFLFLASSQYPASGLLAALVAYRVAYYFLPLMFAAPVLAVFELRANGFQWKTTIGKKLARIESFIPQIFSALLLLGGGILLISGATPGETNRLAWLYHFAPLPLIEFSHLAGSLAGVAMLLLSRAVWKRMDSAYYATVGVMGFGIIASLLKGLDIEEASILSFMLLFFIPSRRYFYRRSSLLSLDYPLEWLAPVAIVIGLSIWLGFFSYKNVEYSNELWWQFSLNGDASRFLRSLIAISVLLCGFSLFRLLTRTNPTLELPGDDMLEKAAAIAFQCNETMPHLALLGDKYLLWSETGNSFIMFRTTHNFWIAMGDPVGDASEFRSLVGNFSELADLHAAKIAFYQVASGNLPLYRELGFKPAMLGEEARVPLQSFNLAGKGKQSLRHAYNKNKREGLTFEIIPAKDVLRIIPQLRTVSDRWLLHKHAKEKCFSLGFFDESYLRRCDVAVTKKDGRILAFANLWTTAKKEELSMDLMRYEPDSPNGVMEFTMVALVLWGRDQGYKWFNLGVAPLSGLVGQTNTPLWNKLGNTIFHFGNEFYNFEGLYHYKNKFEPVWQPKYLVVPRNAQAAPALLAVTSIISGGIMGVFKK
ncbi:MAG TPA: bifunctional lysylphosphatidylglycerol flippase/synthetase MprF [Aestuariivirga sp.]|nr:bifunctional lysylphosphatidylglycerol flippase/synthetase MprF [Aestuariivirga sp.]